MGGDEREPTEVLLVEDNLDHAKLAQDALADAGGYDVRHVRTRADALDRLESRDVDAVVVDYRLPDGDGLKLCTRLRDRSYEGTIVLLSSAAQDRLGDAAIEAGADTYVSKSAAFGMRVADALRADGGGQG